MNKFDINQFRADDWYCLGEKLENRSKRIKCFENAVRMDPNHGLSWHYLGVLYNTGKNYTMSDFCNNKAEQAYLLNLQRYQRHISREEWELESKKNENNNPEKLEFPKHVYDMISDIDSKIDYIIENLGRLYYNMGKLEKAIECYSKLIEEYPNWIHAHFERGNLYYLFGKKHDAISDLRFVIEEQTTDYKSYFMLGKCYEELDLIDRAFWYYNKCVSSTLKFSLDDDAILYRGKANYQLTNFKECLVDAEKILRQNPKNYDFLKLKAEAHLALGQNKHASKCFKKIYRNTNYK